MHAQTHTHTNTHTHKHTHTYTHTHTHTHHTHTHTHAITRRDLRLWKQRRNTGSRSTVRQRKEDSSNSSSSSSSTSGVGRLALCCLACALQELLIGKEQQGGVRRWRIKNCRHKVSSPELWHGTSSSTLPAMWGLLHSLESFLDIIRHKSVQIFTDKSNVVRVMGQGSTDLRLNNIVLRNISITMEHDITLLPTWVPRDQNKVADGLTHLEDPCDWTLNADVFQKIVAPWGLPTIDRFASHSKHLLDRFNCMLRCPGSVGINALAQRD